MDGTLPTLLTCLFVHPYSTLLLSVYHVAGSDIQTPPKSGEGTLLNLT